jgi:DNA-directed RNA polymerase subunit beta'
MDRSLNTAASGYLTRKLVEVGMEAWITMEDCGTVEGLWISNEEIRALGLADMRSRVIGRILAEGTLDVEAGTLLEHRSRNGKDEIDRTSWG